MATTTVLQLQVDAEVLARALAVLDREGLTIEEAVEAMLALAVQRGEMSEDSRDKPAYDAWVRAKVQEALDDPRPGLSDEEFEARIEARIIAVEAKLAAR